MWIKKQQSEPVKEQLTSSKLEKEYDKAVYCHPTYLTYMQNTSCEMWLDETQVGIKITSQEKYQQLQISRCTTPMAESEEELKSLLMRVKEESENGEQSEREEWPRIQHSKN